MINQVDSSNGQGEQGRWQSGQEWEGPSPEPIQGPPATGWEAEPPAPWLTLAAGRFLLDVPPDACAFFGRQGFNEAGPFIQTLPVQDPGEARAMVEARAEALGVPHEEGGTQLERVVTGWRPHSWFIYYWKDTVFKDPAMELNGYFWLDGLLVIFRTTCAPDPGAMADRARLLDAMCGQVRRRAPLAIPREPGFCLREAYFRGSPARYSDEHIELLVSFPSRPWMSLRFCTDTVGEVVANYPRLLEREAGCGGVRIRARDLAVGPFPGQELVRRGNDSRGTPGWIFTWEYLGQPRDPLSPMMVLQLRVRMKTVTTENESSCESNALVVWDEVLGSLRRRESFLRYLRLPGAFRSSFTL